MSGVLNDRSAGRWAVTLAATALMVGGGFLVAVGSATAGGEPENNVGAPGRDGQDATCVVHGPPQEPPHSCTAVGGDGEDGAPGAVYR